MPLILVLITSILTPFAGIYAQPTGNLGGAAMVVAPGNSYSDDTFGASVIETRTWEKVKYKKLQPTRSRRLLVCRYTRLYLHHPWNKCEPTNFKHYLMTGFGLRWMTKLLSSFGPIMHQHIITAKRPHFRLDSTANV